MRALVNHLLRRSRAGFAHRSAGAERWSAGCAEDFPDSRAAVRDPSGTLIPLTAHFVFGLWDATPLPSRYRTTIARWRQQGWRVKIWNESMVADLLQRYPGQQALYQQLSRGAQRADLVRYVIVYDEGGFYFDCDCRPGLWSLRDYLVRHHRDLTALFFVERVISRRRAHAAASRFPIRRGVSEHPERLANFAFGCTARHRALSELLGTVGERCRQTPVVFDDYGVLYTTGPDAVTDTIHGLERSAAIGRLRIDDHRQFMKHLGSGGWRHGKDRRSR